MLYLRRLKPRDSRGALTRLLHRAYRPLAEQGLRYNASRQSRWQTARRVRAGETWVAVDDERLVGTITLRGPAETAGSRALDDPETASFHQFAIDPDYQATGIGSQLLALIERRAADLGARRLALDTASQASELIAYYERRGYEIVDQVSWKSTNYDSVILVKELPARPQLSEGGRARSPC